MDEAADSIDSREVPPAGNAVSLFNQDAAGNDFPVLKAFQQYLDAEQAKARRRMFNLSIFFVVLLVIVAVAFSFILMHVIRSDQANLANIANRNQALSDKLLEIALNRNPAPQPVVNVQQPAAAADSGLKPVLEQLAKLQNDLAAERAVQARVAAQQHAQPVSAQPAVPSVPIAATESDEIKRMKVELKRLQDSLKIEKERLKIEQDKLREQEKENFLRRRYPEYYARKDAEKKGASQERPDAAANKPPSAPASPPSPAVRPVPPQTPPPVAVTPKPKPESKPVEQKPPVIKAPDRKTVPPQDANPKVAAPVALPPPKPIDLKKDKPISYFAEDDDELKSMTRSIGKAKPVTPPSTSNVETINVGKDAKGKGAIPWLVELPDSK